MMVRGQETTVVLDNHRVELMQGKKFFPAIS